MKPKYFLHSFLYSAGVFAYVLGIVLLINNGKNIFPTDSLLIPVFMLLLFVISASITSFLVLSRPIQLYIGGHKREGFLFLSANLGWLMFFLMLTVLLSILK